MKADWGEKRKRKRDSLLSLVANTQLPLSNVGFVAGDGGGGTCGGWRFSESLPSRGTDSERRRYQAFGNLLNRGWEVSS